MKGAKAWLLSNNKNVAHPMEHYDLHEYPYIPQELKSYWNAEVPVNFPKESQKEMLKPGSILYLPGRVWHQTEASDFSVSINITFSLPSLLEVVLAACVALW